MGYVLLSKRFIIIVITINTIAMQKAQAHYKGQVITRTNPTHINMLPPHHREALPSQEVTSGQCWQNINVINSNPQNTMEPQQSLISQLYVCLFGHDEISRKFDTCSPLDRDQQAQIVKEIFTEIQRLQAAEHDYASTLQILQKNGTKMTSEDKWKMIVASYRDKVASLEARLRHEQRAREILQQTAMYESEQKERMTKLNNIKLNKIEALLNQKQQIEDQLEQMNHTVSKLSANLTELKQDNTLLQEQLLESSKINQTLAQQLENIKQQSVAQQHEKQMVSNQMKILGDEEQSISRQITDLKTKYEIEIAQLEHKVSMLTIQEQQYILTIEELEKKGEFMRHSKEGTIDSQTQTETHITTKACYFNSLAHQLDDESYTDQEQDQEPFSNHEFQLGHQQDEVQSQGENEPDLFELPLGSMSASNHMVYTDRPAKEKDHDNLSQKDIPIRRSQLSFEEAQSMISNTPSHYLQTMGELTASLAEAYQKINQLTEQVHELEGEKKKIENKLKEKEVPKGSSAHQVQGKGYFTSFFRK